ncbi:MAG TPA: CocE/NonD family hydrolase [Vicinamibacterales bacterium]|nr:CocE/NonD family hydrolase [Vicinamibacterales bacterium]
MRGPIVLFGLAALALTAPPAEPQPDASFTRTEAMIPMRDGVRLYTQIYSPTQASGPLPILLLRTPYGIGQFTPARLAAALPELVADGYIFVLQDIRGRFKSEGTFVMLRQPRDRSGARPPAAGGSATPVSQPPVDEATDAYDTIEWLLRHVDRHNGRVGIAGTSYGAWLSVMAMLEPHPALRAVVEQASPADMWIGDDFHHNGAFRLSYAFEYAYRMESSKEMADVSSVIDRTDTYEWYLALGPLSNADSRYLHGRLPTWNDFVNHPNYDAFWKRQALAPWLTRVAVPTLNVAGWWDQEDLYGPLTIYELLERHDTARQNFLTVGPWNHGGWSVGDGRRLGPLDFGSPTAAYYRRHVLAPFLAYYLKDKGTLPIEEALTFRTGANEWVRRDQWPPRRGVVERRLYFRADGRLSFEPPPSTTPPAFDEYVSDPAHPVPYRPRPIRLGTGWSTWLVQDQRFVHHRPDVLAWETDPLQDDLVVSGKIVAHLFASTSGSDSDWVVKLIDVYPDPYPQDPEMGGYQLMIAGDVVRGRYRASLEKPQPIAPGAVLDYEVRFPGNDHAFRRGHRLMVQVQSTWFPVIDRNPQRFVPNIFFARETDFRPAIQRVFRSGRHTSFIALPVVVDGGDLQGGMNGNRRRGPETFGRP